MDIFESKNIKPMLIGLEGTPFDDNNFLYELKLDGERCIAYLDKNATELRNKRNDKMLVKFPELESIHKQIKKRCILDGELIVIKEGVPSFSEIKKRSLMSNSFKIELVSQKLPATFTAFDILYADDAEVTDLPLLERKKILNDTIQENERIAISRYIEEKGIQLYNLAELKNLEGIVAKKKDSKYYFDKRTKDWIKIKNLKDEEFIICGYIVKNKSIISIVLGQYDNQEIAYKGHVTLGVSKEDFNVIEKHPRLVNHVFNHLPSGNQDAIWLEPTLVCTVKFMEKTTGGLRQPVFKGLRLDKNAEECMVIKD